MNRDGQMRAADSVSSALNAIARIKPTRDVEGAKCLGVDGGLRTTELWQKDVENFRVKWFVKRGDRDPWAYVQSLYVLVDRMEPLLVFNNRGSRAVSTYVDGPWWDDVVGRLAPALASIALAMERHANEAVATATAERAAEVERAAGLWRSR